MRKVDNREEEILGHSKTDDRAKEKCEERKSSLEMRQRSNVGRL